MQPRTLELQPVTVEELESWAMEPEAAVERSRSFLTAKLASVAFNAEDYDLAA